MVALAQLKDVGVIHTDIKPDNVGIALWKEPWLVVKLLDFGNAIKANEIKLGEEFQPLGYRYVYSARKLLTFHCFLAY